MKKSRLIIVEKWQNIYDVKKRLVWVFLDRGNRDKANETGLKEEGVIEMSTAVLPFTLTIITI